MSPPEGLKHLNSETSEEILGKFRDYAWCDKEYGKIIFTEVQKRRLIFLMDWVKDKNRLEEEALFPYGTTRHEFIHELEEATTRKKWRKEQNKVGESLITTSFQVQIEAAGKWDCWVVELEGNLKINLGAQGIPLSYPIRENNTHDQIEVETWDKKSVLTVPLTGRLYNQDNLTVHNIILCNISDASYAFTYVKSYIKKDDGINDIKALLSKYENVAMQEQYLSKSKRTIDTIQYRDERAMTFETFVSKIVKSINELEKRGTGMHNAEMFENIW